MREVQDHYFRLAKSEGFVSRAAYKLIEIDDRRRLLRKGDRVLDCGCAPGSWLQVASRRVGPRGVVVGIDLQPVLLPLEANMRVIKGDFTTMEQATLLDAAGNPPHGFDVVLSDMAPNTSGDSESDHFRSVRLCETVLGACSRLLRTGGNMVMKVFEGAGYRDLLQRTDSLFDSARGFKPKASRSESVEMFIVATGFNGARHARQDPTPQEPPPRRPSSGWSSS